MRMTLECMKKGHKKEIWELKIKDEDTIDIHNPAGELVDSFDRGAVVNDFVLPSFVQSVPYSNIPLSGELWAFKISKGDTRKIKQFIDQSVVSDGADSIDSVRKTAMRDLLIGIPLALVGIGISVASFVAASGGAEGGRYTLTTGMIGVGLFWAGKGLYGLNRHKKLMAMSRT